MQLSESNPLRQALVKGAAPGPHPDADLLTAYAEGGLIERERRAVLDHLASCVECRQVLAVSIDAAPAAVAPSRPAWFPIRVLAPTLAAVIVVAAITTWVERRQSGTNQAQSTVAVNRNQPAPQPQNPPTPAQAQANTLSARKVAPSRFAAPPPAMKAQRSEQIAGAIHGTVQMSAAAPESAQPQTQQQAVQSTPVPGTETVQVQAQQSDIAPSQRTLGVSQQSSQSEKPVPAAQAPSANAPAPFAYDRSAGTAGAEFSNAVTSDALKRAPQASLARPHWRISAQGQPERSFTGGNWQTVLPNATAKMRVLSVFAGEVWVGGEKGQVFRSFDNGETWRLVLLPEKNGSGHLIAHIRFHSAQEITVEAADGTAWTSTDGGETWK